MASRRGAKRSKASASESTQKEIQKSCSMHEFNDVDKVERMRKNLLAWYDSKKRSLPWRSLACQSDEKEYESDPDRRGYAVWISEVMLQQTQVATVIGYYKRWMSKWPDTKALSSASLDDVNAVWSGLGYYSRARRLWEGAKKVEEELGGRMPRDSASLQKDLPGVGRYTACAVASIAYGEASAVVDGNVARVVARLARIGADPTSKIVTEQTWDCAGALLHRERPGDFNQAVMELGATVCTPRNPSCSSCPLSNNCAAFALAKNRSKVKQDENAKIFANTKAVSKSKGTKPADIEIEDLVDDCPFCPPEGVSATYASEDIVASFPRKAAKKAKKEGLALVLCLSKNIKGEDSPLWLTTKRSKDAGLLAGLLEFVNVELNAPDERDCASDIKFVRRKLESLVGSYTAASCLSLRGEVVHVFSHIRQTYVVWTASLDGEVDLSQLGREFQWLTQEGIASAGVSTAMRKVFALATKKDSNNTAKRKQQHGSSQPDKKIKNESGGQKSITAFFSRNEVRPPRARGKPSILYAYD